MHDLARMGSQVACPSLLYFLIIYYLMCRRFFFNIFLCSSYFAAFLESFLFDLFFSVFPPPIQDMTMPTLRMCEPTLIFLLIFFPFLLSSLPRFVILDALLVWFRREFGSRQLVDHWIADWFDGVEVDITDGHGLMKPPIACTVNCPVLARRIGLCEVV